ncbi:MAG: hypothetical protein SPF56_03625 [Bacteroidaceae bacterium]|nr:hypothetical protein [Prevotellaceae bacterium]MDY5631576.1 hypothetical protein [Bacteroidaceae bacterium]
MGSLVQAHPEAQNKVHPTEAVMFLSDVFLYWLCPFPDYQKETENRVFAFVLYLGKCVFWQFPKSSLFSPLIFDGFESADCQLTVKIKG